MFAGIKKFFRNLINLETNQRKNIALWMMFGGAIVFTAYATFGLWLLQGVPHYVFWLAIAAHIHVFSIMAGYIGLLIKRRIFVGKDGLGITDSGGDIETPQPIEQKAAESTTTVPQELALPQSAWKN